MTSLAHCDVTKKLSHAKAGINRSQTPGACLARPGVRDKCVWPMTETAARHCKIKALCISYRLFKYSDVINFTVENNIRTITKASAFFFTLQPIKPKWTGPNKTKWWPAAYFINTVKLNTMEFRAWISNYINVEFRAFMNNYNQHIKWVWLLIHALISFNKCWLKGPQGIIGSHKEWYKRVHVGAMQPLARHFQKSCETSIILHPWRFKAPYNEFRHGFTAVWRTRFC